MAIHFDRTRWAVVVVCDGCGWQDLGVTREAAWALAADHERRAHPEERAVRNAQSHRENYRAKKTDGTP